MMSRSATAAVGAALALLAAFSSGCSQDRARFTILLGTMSMPGVHTERARHYLDQTEKHTGWKGLFLVHEAGKSKLYWGRYATQQQAEHYLAKAHAYEAPYGGSIYRGAVIVPFPGSTKPQGPPAYDLARRASEDIRYTLIVAEFLDDPKRFYVGREKFAAQYCQQLRNEGHEAFYYHGSVKSFVTVGDFPQSAYQWVRAAQAADKGAQRRLMVAAICDPKFQKLAQTFPELATNGRRHIVKKVNAQTGKMAEFPEPSYIMEIPRKQTSDGDSPLHRSSQP